MPLKFRTPQQNRINFEIKKLKEKTWLTISDEVFPSTMSLFGKQGEYDIFYLTIELMSGLKVDLSISLPLDYPFNEPRFHLTSPNKWQCFSSPEVNSYPNGLLCLHPGDDGKWEPSNQLINILEPLKQAFESHLKEKTTSSATPALFNAASSAAAHAATGQDTPHEAAPPAKAPKRL